MAVLTCVCASAYTVSSDYAEGCHEKLTLTAYLNYGIDLPADRIPVPTGDVYTAIADSIASRLFSSQLDDQQEVVIVSLLVGVRSPDTDGHALLDFDSLRTLHGSPEGQYHHALRSVDDDGDEGNSTAVEGIRQHITDTVLMAGEYLMMPVADQIIEAPFYLDFYGLVDIEVWAPAYYLGRAIHALQDSFSHTLRGDGFQKIIHVFNYAEAIGAGFDEKRDGLAHSDSMDKCVGETAPMVNAAEEATTDLFITLRDGETAADERGAGLSAFLDRWVVYQEGCNGANAYCDSPWLPVVREEQTGPYLETYLGCETAGPPAALWLWRRR
jgi:hypothetical protein